MLQVSAWANLSGFHSLIFIYYLSFALVVDLLVRPEQALDIFLTVFNLHIGLVVNFSNTFFGQPLTFFDHSLGDTPPLVRNFEFHQPIEVVEV